MGKRTPPFEAYPVWTTARFWSFIRAGLRGMYRRWPPKFTVLKNSRRAVKKGRQRWEFQCALCSKWFKQTEVEVDHLIPAGRLNTYDDLPLFVSRLFCPEDKLQCVCKVCHKKKTKEEKV